MKLANKSLDELIDHYRQQVEITSKIDYLNKKTVRENNKAVNVMYEIVELIKNKFGDEGTVKFSLLLDVQDDITPLWVAPQMLQKMKITEEIKKKALRIIEEIADSEHPSATGFKMWLEDYYKTQ